MAICLEDLMFDRQTEQDAVVTVLYKAVDSPRICLANSLEDGTLAARCQLHVLLEVAGPQGLRQQLLGVCRQAIADLERSAK